jgi:hypothetical protein
VDVALRNEETGAAVARGTHVKFIADSEPVLTDLLVAAGRPRL